MNLIYTIDEKLETDKDTLVILTTVDGVNCSKAKSLFY